MQPRHSEALIFSAKAALAAMIAALSYDLIDLPGAPWVAAVSAVLVTQADLHSSFKVSLLRVLANLFGAFGGAALCVVIGHPVVAMTIGIMVTGLACYLLKQDDALRPAAVAVILVTLFGDSSKWQASLHRVSAVVIGCLCALAIGFLFDQASNLVKVHPKTGLKKNNQQE